MPTTTLGIAYPSLTDAPEGPAQMQALAEDVDALITADRALRDGAATSYTPSITGSTSGTWSAGASTLNAYYLRTGRLVTVWGAITCGASVSITGSVVGSLRISLPVATKSGHPEMIGTAWAVDTSAGAAGRWVCTAQLDSTTVFSMFRATDGVTIQHNTVTWASGDLFRWEVRYEAASAP